MISTKQFKESLGKSKQWKKEKQITIGQIFTCGKYFQIADNNSKSREERRKEEKKKEIAAHGTLGNSVEEGTGRVVKVKQKRNGEEKNSPNSPRTASYT